MTALQWWFATPVCVVLVLLYVVAGLTVSTALWLYLAAICITVILGPDAEARAFACVLLVFVGLYASIVPAFDVPYEEIAP